LPGREEYQIDKLANFLGNSQSQCVVSVVRVLAQEAKVVRVLAQENEIDKIL